MTKPTSTKCVTIVGGAGAWTAVLTAAPSSGARASSRGPGRRGLGRGAGLGLLIGRGDGVPELSRPPRACDEPCSTALSMWKRSCSRPSSAVSTRARQRSLADGRPVVGDEDVVLRNGRLPACARPAELEARHALGQAGLEHDRLDDLHGLFLSCSTRGSSSRRAWVRSIARRVESRENFLASGRSRSGSCSASPWAARPRRPPRRRTRPGSRCSRRSPDPGPWGSPPPSPSWPRRSSRCSRGTG